VYLHIYVTSDWPFFFFLCDVLEQKCASDLFFLLCFSPLTCIIFKCCIHIGTGGDMKMCEEWLCRLNIFEIMYLW